MAGLSVAQNPALVPPQPYYFNASRQLWTGNPTDEITLNNIRRYDYKTSLWKVVRIAILCIPAFLYDLVRTAVARCMGSREVRPVVVAQELALVPSAEVAKQERTDVLLTMLTHITPLAALVIAYLPQKQEASLVSQELSVETIFSFPKQMQDLVYVARGLGNVNAELWGRIQEIPNVERIYSNIEGFDFVAFFGGPDRPNEKFLELIEQFPRLKRLGLPDLRNDRDTTWVEAIQKRQGSLEEVHWTSSMGNLPFPGDSVIEALLECPRLKGLSMEHWSFLDRNIRNPKSWAALAQKGQLTRLRLHQFNFSPDVFRQFFQHCPLQHVDVRFVNGILPSLPADLIYDLARASESRPQGQKLLSLKYYAFNLREAHFRELVRCCPDLEYLEVPATLFQGNLFAELLPQWKQIKSFDFSAMSNVQILTTVRNTPSLQRIRIIINKYGNSTLDVVEDLAKLGRPLILDIGWLRNLLTDQQKARLEQRLKPYPHMKIIKTVEEQDSMSPFSWKNQNERL